jgi:hypothetical protein
MAVQRKSWTSNFKETGTPLGVLIREHMNKIKQGLMEKSRLAKHAYKEVHRTE